MNDQIDAILYEALEEDIPTLDITSDNLLQNQQGEAVILAKENGVVSGINIVLRLFQILDDDIYMKIINHDGVYVEENDIIAIISGNLSTLLKGKRLALNILRRMSGIATKTKSYVDQVSDTFVKIIDSRDNTPNFRLFEKLAVTHGGGMNSRSNLSDQVRIEQSHIHAVGSVKGAVDLITSRVDQSVRIEIEINTFEQFLEAIHTKCDIIILRDMTITDLSKCSSHNTDRLVGTISTSFDDVKDISKTGIDFIIVDELTHSFKTLDIELNINK